MENFFVMMTKKKNQDSKHLVSFPKQKVAKCNDNDHA